MKKNSVKAMALGLSAVTLASAMEVPVQAAEFEVGRDPVKIEDPAINHVANAETVAEKSVEVIEKQVETDNVAEDVDAIEEIANEEAIQGEFDTTDVVEKAEVAENGIEAKPETETEPAVEAQDSVEKSLEDAENNISNMKDARKEAKQSEAEMKEAVLPVMKPAVEAVPSIEYADKVSVEAKDEVMAAIEADDKTAAEASLKKGDEAVQDAQEKYDALKKAFDEAMVDFEKSLKDYETAKEKYDTNKAGAVAELETAEKELAELEAALAELEEEVEAAAKELAATAAGAIISADENRKDNRSWNNTDLYFNAIMANYYIPELVLAEGETLDGEVSCQWIKDSKNSEKNYCLVTYTVVDAEGNKKTVSEKYNYKIGEKNSVSENEIKIFKKTVVYSYVNEQGEKTVVAQEDIDALVAKGEAAACYTLNGKRYTKSQLEAAGFSVDTEGVTLSYVILGEKISETVDDTTVSAAQDQVFNGAASKFTKTVVGAEVMGDDVKSTRCYFDENGNYIVEETKGSTITRYTYEQGILTATDFDTADDANKAALVAMVADDDIEYGNVITEADYYKAIATYRLMYTKNLGVADAWASWSAGSQAIWNGYAATVEGAYTWVKDDVTHKWYTVDTRRVSSQETTSIKVGRKRITTGYTTKGHVEVDYEEVTSEKVDYKTFWKYFGDLFKGNPTKAEIEAAMKLKIESEGGTYLGMDILDWDAKTATVHYVKGQQIAPSTHYATAQQAVTAGQKAAVSEAKSKGGKAEGVQSKAEDYYKYSVDYIEKTGEETVDDTYVENDVYENTETTTEDSLSNYNYTEKNEYWSDLYEKDGEQTAFGKFMESAQAKYNSYKELLAKLTSTKAKVADEKTKVNTLKEFVNKMELAGSEEFSEFEAAGKKTLSDAKDKLDAAKKRMQEARDAYNNKWPAPAPIVPGQREPEYVPPVGNIEQANLIDTQLVTIADDTVPAAGPARRARVAAANTEVIEDTETPLAVEDEKTETVADDTKQIADEEVPEAAEQTKRNWWWLILVALGVAGGTTYAVEKNKKKKAVESVDNK